MMLDVRTMYIAMGAIVFHCRGALHAPNSTVPARRCARVGPRLGFQGAFYVLVGLRGIAGTFFR